MFSRRENGKLRFERLDFEVMIADLIEQCPPKGMGDLRWMIKCMVDAVQIVGWEFANEELEEEWEDVFFPADGF